MCDPNTSIGPARRLELKHDPPDKQTPSCTTVEPTHLDLQRTERKGDSKQTQSDTLAIKESSHDGK